MSSAVSDTSPASLDGLRGAVAGVAEIDWAEMKLGPRLQMLTELETQLRRLHAVACDGARTVSKEERNTLGDRPAMVLANALRITPGEARGRIRDADLMTPELAISGAQIPPAFDQVAGPWRAGTLDAEHVRVIRDFFTYLPDKIDVETRTRCQSTLVELATQHRPDHLRVLAKHLADIVVPDGVLDPQTRQRKRGLHLSPAELGMTKISGYLTPEAAAALEAVFAAYAAPGVSNPDAGGASDAGEAARSADRADADAPGCDADPNLHPDLARLDAARTDSRTQGQRQHDALLAIAAIALKNGPIKAHNGLPVTIIARANLEDLSRGTGTATTAGGTGLPIADLIAMAAPAYPYLAIFDHATELPLYLGRTRRLANLAQRLALLARDGGCTFPNCPHPAYLCEVDHLKDWANGGTTDIDALGLACCVHNIYKTTYRWTVTRNPATGAIEWQPPPDTPGGGTNTYHKPQTHWPPTEHNDP